ncbi:flagellar filament capping protein FliD [Paenibacillus sp. CF384]|uniref:flagellar filament capping protein FliD n=1 Tax=Paenibacillus sp. CF384 TaxID=1884382 RepID=UPI00089B9708|nr:flagellar filament capping protein FliD [Paenibacillus sp. CF384]SDX28482.1 flagellar hook-associated protein 2 [Paenibacillus sp. CF384]
MRISGLASGLDVDQIVKDMVKAKKGPVNRLNQQKQTLEWQREQYRDITTKLVDFRNNKLFTYGLQSGVAAKGVNVSGNTTAVSAKANPNAITGSLSVEVTSLATAAKVTSTANIALGSDGIAGVDTSKTLSQLKLDGEITYNDPDGDGKISFDIKNGNSPAVTITVNVNDKLSDAVAAINGSAANVSAFIDSATGRLSLSSKSTGAGSLVLTDTSSFLSSFSLPLTSPVADKGTDAVVKINGISTTRSSNVFTENGVEITLNAPTGGIASTISVVTNTDKVVDTIKSFIKDFNDVLDSVTSKINEERFRKYLPLTSDDKAAMKEAEITLWEEKAKSGLLRNDSTLTKLESDIRLSSITDVTIDGKKMVIGDLGIDSVAWENRGKLTIKDESKLRAAIEADPERVMKFFTQQTTETNATLKVSPTNPDNGVFNRLSNVVMSALDELSSRVGTSKVSTDKNGSFLQTSIFSKNLRDIDVKINDENDRLTRLETSYYKKFTAMETAMNRYNSQSSSLFSSM